MKTLPISRALRMLLLPLLAQASGQTNINLPPAAPETAPLVFREVQYTATVSDQEARFGARFDLEAPAGEVSQVLLAGEVAMLPARLPSGLRIERNGNEYRLFSSRKGRHVFGVDFVARITRAEPWNQVTFLGPVAAIASISAQAAGADAELRLLQGTTLESLNTNGMARLKGYLSASPEVSLRWSRGTGETARKAVVTVDTAVHVQVTPTVIKQVTAFHYEILQGKLSRLSVRVPARQTVTRVLGDQVRDWELKTDPGTDGAGVDQVLTVELIKPMEKQYVLTLHSEETVDAVGGTRPTACPEPLGVERESGLMTITTEDVLAEIDQALSLRQVNAPAGVLAAYRFSGRPFTLALKLSRIQPVIQVAERVAMRLEETRLLAAHKLAVTVEKAGIYALELPVGPPWAVADVQGSGVEDWKVVDAGASNRVLRVSFSSRVLGARTLDVQLEQPLKTFPAQVELRPLRVIGASRETSQVGAGSARGIRLKTDELSGAREIPLNRLGALPDELLAYAADQPDWVIRLGTERQSARVVADIFNLVTIGDGIVGGSATLRFGLLNQGVQEFELAVPAAWKNVEFTGPDIRRKEQRPDGTWVIGLQEKAWGGYTLVVTYDFQFDPRGATLSLGGIHAPGVERETGWVAVTTAASLKLDATKVSETFRAVDEAELTAADRALIGRAVLLSYQYSQPQYSLEVEVKRYGELPVLSAVADRTELTTVLTDSGELLSQASFMVKNNDKQFQRFKLPAKARFWGCYVNGAAVKADKDGDWLLAPLPRGANRDQAFAVDIVYAEKKPLNASLFSGSLQLEAPQTDVPNTYAEWQLFAPTTLRLSAFQGNMTPARGTTYDFRDAWQKFVDIYRDLLTRNGLPLLGLAVLVVLIVSLVGSAARRGWSGVLSVVVVFAIIALLSAMMLPALSRAKARAQRINAVNNLKQIGLAAKVYSMDNGDRLPASLRDMMSELGTDKILSDPETGQQFIYVGAGLDANSILPESVIAFSPTDTGGHRAVLLADGSVQQLSSAKFSEISQRGFIVHANPQQVAANQQATAIRSQQFGNAPGTSAQVAQVDAAAGLPAPKGAMRIEIPRSGQAFTFTKVLNAGREPLSIRARLMKLQTFETARMVLQVAAFLAGLGLWTWAWRNTRSSFLLTLALSLSLGAVLDLLVARRLLHMGLIFGVPVLLLLVVGWATWKFWPRARKETPVPVLGPDPETPSALVSTILICLLPLLALSASAAEPAAPTAAVGAATYTGIITGKVAAIDALLTITSTWPNAALPLFGDDVAVQQFSCKSGDVKLVRRGTGVSVVLPRKGEVTLQLKLLAALSGDVTRRELAFGIPPALTTRVQVDIDQPEADVEFPTAVSHKRTTVGERTRVEALIGSGERVELRWTPRVKRAAEITANIICQNWTVARLANGAVNARSSLEFQATQGEIRQLRVRLPAGHRLLRVEGESIRTWDAKPEGAEQVLTVELLKPAAPVYTLLVETEKVLEALPATVRVEVPHATEVKRETGLVAVQSDEELDVTIQRAEELLRVDAEEFAKTAGTKITGQPNVFRFLKPGFGLEARVSLVQPQIEATVRNALRVSPDQVSLNAVIDYVIKRAGVFKLTVALPDDYKLESVTGTNVLQWAASGPAGARQLEVLLKERTSGAYRLGLELTRTLKELAPTLELAGVHPAADAKLTGFISVSAEPGVGLKPGVSEGLTEIPAVSAGSETASASGSVLAYKYFGTGRPGWKLSVQTEAMQSWVRAEVVNTLTVADAAVSGRALVRYEIQNAPIKELKLKIPAGFRNVEISGSGIRRRDHDGEVWRIEFQNKVKGRQVLTVTWDQARAAGTNVFEVRGISAEGVERETGIVAIVARPPLQVSGSDIGELKPIDIRDLPEWAGRPEEGTALAYRYSRPGYALELEARRFQQAEFLQTLAENISLTTVVSDDGQAMTEISLSVRNHGRQHLEVTLPPGSTVWSAFVAGQPVRPSLREGRLLLPLEQSGQEGAAVGITLTYIGTNAFPTRRGELELASPQLDVPLKAARWDLFLPPDYAYDHFAGTMTRELAGAGTAAVASSFSQLDYRHLEVRNKADQANEVKSELSSAQKKLSAGNVKEALVDFNRAKSRANYNTDRGAGTAQLEADLKRAQGSNLILAQNTYSVNNGSVAGDVHNQPLRYDNASAEQQWLKLQQAQEILAERVQPIHVNLPTRGLRYSFAQVLQTEPGRPMTIRLQADNEKVVNWPARLGTLATLFAALWLGVYVMTRHGGRQPAGTLSTASPYSK